MKTTTTTTTAASTPTASRSPRDTEFELRTGWTYADALEEATEARNEHNDHVSRWDFSSLFAAALNSLKHGFWFQPFLS